MLKETMETRYDTAADVLYLISAEGEIARSVEVAPGITMEYGDSGEVLGLEILRASKVFGETIVASLHARQAGVIE
jgi:uncharacterized protein YuzE